MNLAVLLMAVTLLDFDDPAEAGLWRPVDDVVMGGVSASEMVIENGVAVFRGRVSLDNNGGFASVRSSPKRHDLSGFSGIVLRMRGDGRRYVFRLRTTTEFDGVSYQAKLQPESGVWQDIFVSFDQFEPFFRGRRVEGHPSLDVSNIQTFGLLIADRQEGLFQLELASVSVAVEN